MRYICAGAVDNRGDGEHTLASPRVSAKLRCYAWKYRCAREYVWSRVNPGIRDLSFPPCPPPLQLAPLLPFESHNSLENYPIINVAALKSISVKLFMGLVTRYFSKGWLVSPLRLPVRLRMITCR